MDTHLIAPRSASTPILDRPLQILIADDSLDNRELIRAYLKKTPYLLVEAEDGQEAIDKFIAGNFDVVLMDIHMPNVDGYEATSTIRVWELANSARRTPIVALTASVLGEAMNHSIAAGCDAHITKPVKKSTLLEAIRDVIEANLLDDDTKPACQSQGGNMPDRVIVEVDEDLTDLIPGFLTHKRADIDTIFDAVTRRDYAEVGRIAHRVKGEGGSYGFDAMTEMGRSLEHAAAIRDGSAVTTLARQLLSYLDRVEVVFQPSRE